jgi:hypothetical protein
MLFHIVRSAAPIAGQPEMAENLDLKMKSEVTALL